MILLLWIYYSSMVLFFGAEFTQVYARRHGSGIQPAKGAVRTEQGEAEEAKRKADPTSVTKKATRGPRIGTSETDVRGRLDTRAHPGLGPRAPVLAKADV